MTTTQKNENEGMYKSLARVKNTIFKHPKYAQAFNEIEKVFCLKLHADVARNILCLGSPGTGKTTLKNQFQAKYPPQKDGDRELQHLICVETPSKPTIKNMAETILLALGDPIFYRGSAMQKTQRIRILVEQKEVKMIVIDELQHFVDHCGNRGAAEVSDWLKTIMEDTRISFVLMGLPRSAVLLNINSQLKRRFSQRVKLPPFSIDSAEEIQILGSVISQIDKLFNLPVPISITVDRVSRFYKATNGIIDYLVKLLMTAYEIGISTNTDKLSDDILEEAFTIVIYDDCKPKHNPFAKSFNGQSLDGVGMPFYEGDLL